jgi:hypothetical protein
MNLHGLLRSSIGVLVAALLFCSGDAARGALLLHIDDSANNLGTVDVSTGVGGVTVIGNMGADVMTDIAFDASGNLFGISFTNLYRINTTTAAATLVGALGLASPGNNSLVFGSNGVLYAASVSTGHLYTVNTSTGLATDRGDIGFFSSGDLAFNGGALYMSSTSDRLIRIALDGSDNVVGVTDVGGLGFSNVFGLATGSDGVLYGVSGTTVFSVNTATGAGTFVRDYSGFVLGSANGTSFFTEAGATVPEPASIVMFGLGALGLGFIGCRRRNLAA